MADFDNLSENMDALGQSVAQSTQMVAAFRGEMGKLQSSVTKTSYDITSLEKGLSKGFKRAIDGVIFDGMKLSDALKSILSSVINTAYSRAVTPVTDHLGGLVGQGISALMGGLFPFANGGVMTSGRVTAFAKGGVLDGPTTFPMRGGTGLMGEAGPEAIMPLTRGADGRLGVAAQGGNTPMNVTINIQTPDVQGFQRSRSQIAAQMQRALQAGQRNS